MYTPFLKPGPVCIYEANNQSVCVKCNTARPLPKNASEQNLRMRARVKMRQSSYDAKLAYVRAHSKTA